MIVDMLYSADSNREHGSVFVLSVLLIVSGTILFPQQDAMAQDQADAQEDVVLEDQEDLVLDEIVVSARRRDEFMQQTPISITALSGDELDAKGITTLVTLGNFVPNVQTAGAAAGGTAVGAFFIRGIGSTRSGINEEPPVGVYLDGVFLGSFDGALLEVINPKRIEVLRGPQGTLFGKNALAGAIQYISQEPGDQFEGDVKGAFGRFHRIDVSGNVNIPVSETVAVRLTGASFSRDGVVDRKRVDDAIGALIPAARDEVPNTNDIGTNFLRADVMWRPKSNFSARLAADVTTRNTNGPGNVVIGDVDLSGLPGVYLAAGFDLRTGLTGDPFESTASSPVFLQQEEWGVNLTLDWAVNSWLALKSITSFRESDLEFLLDIDATPFRFFDQTGKRPHKQVTQEFQLIGTYERLNWIFGLFAFDENARDDPRTTFLLQELGTPLQDDSFVEDNQSYAAFADATYQLTDIFSISAGGRFTYEEKESFASRDIRNDGNAPISGINSDDFEEFTPRIVAQAQWTPDVMTYISWSTGFKSGGFNNRVDPSLPNNGFFPFNEETIESFEFGVRSEWLDNRLRFNATYFNSDYDDIQVGAANPETGDFFTQNAGKASVDGVEVEGNFLLTDRLRVDFGVAYLDAEFTDLGGGELVIQDISLDTEFARAPEVSYNLSGQYVQPIPNGGTVEVRLDWGWQDDQQLATSDSTSLPQEAFGLLNARIEYTDPEQRWKFALYGTNLTDEAYITSGLHGLGLNLATFGDPLEWGVSSAYNF